MHFSQHTAYINARELSKIIWNISRRWDKYVLSTIGSQLIRSTDSISANIAEGWNRYTKKDKINFYVIARGSAAETSDWIEKALERRLINKEDYIKLQQLLCNLPKLINGLIKGTNQNLRK